MLKFLFVSLDGNGGGLEIEFAFEVREGPVSGTRCCVRFGERFGLRMGIVLFELSFVVRLDLLKKSFILLLLLSTFGELLTSTKVC